MNKLTLEDNIQQRIAYWENQYCNIASFGGDVTGAMSVLMELSALIGEVWTAVGIFERDRARESTNGGAVIAGVPCKILVDMRRDIKI